MHAWVATGAVAMMLAGCGGADRAPAKSPDGSWNGGSGSSGPSADQVEASPTGGSPMPSAPSATQSAPGGAVAGMSPPPPAPPTARDEVSESRGGSDWKTPEPQPQNRPGLGTEWGETRESHIREVGFFRNDPDRPFAVASLFYNDRSGVEAMAAFHGGTPRFHDVSAANGAITVSVRDAWGEPLDAMRVGDRVYVVGQEGERYSIVIANHTARRFEAVATVDGLDVINGKTGTFANRGYVLMPWASVEIDGFRQSESAVAAFRFAKVRDSYAAQRGEARNVGVIGVAFFAERGDDWSASELHTRDTASPFPSEGRFAPPPR
ncbi:MAG TPA: hypothetical protein VIF15_05220 [Polyangiaceae bacterium]